MMVTQDGHNLVLLPDQRLALAVISASAHALNFVGNVVRTAASPSMLTAANAVLAATKCPFGSGPGDLITDFDSGGNMYIRCLHAPRHCWNMSGHSIACP